MSAGSQLPRGGTAPPGPLAPSLVLCGPDQGSGLSPPGASRSWLVVEKVAVRPRSLGPGGRWTHLSFQAWRRPHQSQWAPRSAWRARS